MTKETPPGGTPDRSTLRRASLKVAVRISAACAVMVLCLLAVAALYLMNKLARPELPAPTAAGTTYAYLDSRDLLEAMIIAGLAGIALAGLVGWLSARSAIRPLGEALALQRSAEPDSKQGRELAKIREDAATLTGIVNELLLAATTEAPDPAAEPVDLADVAGAVTQSLEQLAAANDVRLAFSAGGR